MVSLGKGYYNFQFDAQGDRNRAWSRRTWNISPGVLRLQQWVPDFNPYKIKSTVAQVWIRIYELSLEYWHYPIIMGIAKAVGNPIKIDENSMSGRYGHYVRVLVEMDLSLNIQEHVLIERTGCTKNKGKSPNQQKDQGTKIPQPSFRKKSVEPPHNSETSRLSNPFELLSTENELESSPVLTPLQD